LVTLRAQWGNAMAMRHRGTDLMGPKVVEKQLSPWLRRRRRPHHRRRRLPNQEGQRALQQRTVGSFQPNVAQFLKTLRNPLKNYFLPNIV
jgi:hypothetical protein